ncbi:hypothetical protein [Methylobacterium organophilum]|uniref:Uncharacterized protein n=1 Tax=Methylobacterium organophilum TaxID=410 RepID=A0ABQ4T2J6_METOR|nr:hypothetical protein [Methylobacterium organophilum]GJE25448.1 hypothetical protein LKMONMHP_0286 [Methylobacterium organophilum]
MSDENRDKRPDARGDRLKAALRDNLRRRKDQARGRSEEPGEAVAEAHRPGKPTPGAC